MPTRGAADRSAPIGALVVSPDGRSKFYPEGGRDRPASGRRRDPSPLRRQLRGDDDRQFGTKRSPGAQAVYFNNSFLDKPAFGAYDMPMRTPRDYDDDDDDDDVTLGGGSENDPPLSPRQATCRSLLIFSCAAVAVLLVVALAIIFPIAFVGSTSSGPTVTGVLQLDTPFIAAYNDTGSTEYTNIVADFTTVMDGIFQASSTYSGSFRETSVSDLAAGTDASTATTQVSFSLVFSSGTDVTPLFRNNVYGFVYTEITKAASPFASLNVLADSLSITDSCDVYCANGGVVSVIECTCTCLSGFNGTTCENAL